MIASQVLVRLKTPDPQATTARTTLQARLGFHSSLVALDRCEYYELVFDTGTRELAIDDLQQIATETTLLANPNKETCELFVEPDTAPVVVGAILVWDREGADDEALRRRIRRAFSSCPIVAVRHGTLWVPSFARPLNEWPELARRLADAHERTSGLLANPNTHAFTILPGSLPHASLRGPAIP
jgi:phosphoribosylformylglycinamidine (FGAM) synthase PurS component